MLDSESLNPLERTLITHLYYKYELRKENPSAPFILQEMRTTLQKSPSIYLMYQYGKACARLGANSADALSCMETVCKFENVFPNAAYWAGMLAQDLVKRSFYWQQWLKT